MLSKAFIVCAGTPSGSSVQCTTGKYNCSYVKDSTACLGLDAGPASWCWWSDSCEKQDISRCSTITIKSLCHHVGCTWSNNSCGISTCAAAHSCTFIRGDYFGQSQLCSCANNVYADATETSALTASTCYVQTGQTYAWNGQACVKCSSSNVHFNPNPNPRFKPNPNPNPRPNFTPNQFIRF